MTKRQSPRAGKLTGAGEKGEEMMNWTTEQRIRNAIRQGDAKELHDAIDGAPSWDRDFDEIIEIVEDEPGGWRHTRWNRIELDDPYDGCTTVTRRGFRAESEHEDSWD